MSPVAIQANRRWLERLEDEYGGTLLGAQRASEVNAVILAVADKRKIAYNGGQDHGPANLRNRLGDAAQHYFEWAFSENLTAKNIYPNNPFPEPPIGQPNWLKKEQLKALYYEKSFELIDQAMIRFLVDTGCRVSEMVATNVEQLDLEKGNVYIYMNKVKAPKVSALTPITCRTLKKIISRRRRPGNHIFEGRQGRLTDKTVRVHFSKIAEEVGFRINPHSFRHGGTSLYYHRHGALAAKAYAGHQVLSSTAKYVHFVEQDMRQLQKARFSDRPAKLVEA